MLWAMKMQEWPESRALRTNRSTPWVSATPRLLVGSSRMMRSLSKNIARAIATACRSPPDSEPIGQGRLSRAVVAEKPDDLLPRDVEVDVVERLHAAEKLVDALHPHELFGHRSSPRLMTAFEPGMKRHHAQDDLTGGAPTALVTRQFVPGWLDPSRDTGARSRSRPHRH